jgi:atypical dual specificity phosphatase
VGRLPVSSRKRGVSVPARVDHFRRGETRPIACLVRIAVAPRYAVQEVDPRFSRLAASRSVLDQPQAGPFFDLSPACRKVQDPAPFDPLSRPISPLPVRVLLSVPSEVTKSILGAAHRHHFLGYNPLFSITYNISLQFQMSCVKIAMVRLPSPFLVLQGRCLGAPPLRVPSFSLPFLPSVIIQSIDIILMHLTPLQPCSQQPTTLSPVQMSYRARSQWSAPLRPSLSTPISPSPYPSTPGPFTTSAHAHHRTSRGASEIIPRLYISDLSFAENPACLSSYGITHVLSTLADNVLAPTVHPAPMRLQIKVEDFPFAELAAHLPTTTSWIREAFRSSPDARVLVHCGEGISRSVSVVAAFLMAQYGWSPVEAVQYIKSKRRVADPNFGFVQQLGEYSKSLGTRTL